MVNITSNPVKIFIYNMNDINISNKHLSTHLIPRLEPLPPFVPPV